jgi:hypothetical protein
MANDEQDRRIDGLEARLKALEDSVGTAKVWVKVIITVAATLGIGAVPFLKILYSEYKGANDNAAQIKAENMDAKDSAARIEAEFKEHEVALRKLDDWSKSSQTRVSAPPRESQTAPENQGLTDLSKRIRDFVNKDRATYPEDVQDLRNFALEYFNYVIEHPAADENGRVLGAIKEAVDTAVARHDFTQDTPANRDWHQSYAPRDFKDFLSKFQRDRKALNSETIACYKSEISFWYTSLSTGAPGISDICRSLGINPYE